jgi:hypothetical protein
MCFSSFMRDMKVFTVYYPHQTGWLPLYLRGIRKKCTMRGWMRQISGQCVRRIAIARA